MLGITNRTNARLYCEARRELGAQNAATLEGKMACSVSRLPRDNYLSLEHHAYSGYHPSLWLPAVSSLSPWRLERVITHVFGH
jgi:hypothetical protein